MTSVFSLVNGVSGIAFIGLAVAAARHQDRRLGVGLASFLLAWGVEATLVNTSDLVNDSSIKILLRNLASFLYAAVPLTLLYAVSIPREGEERNASNWRAFRGFGVVLALSIAAVIAAVIKPALIFGEGRVRYELLGVILLLGPQFIGTAVALILAAQTARHQNTEDVVRSRVFSAVWLSLAALTVFDLAAFKHPTFLENYRSQFGNTLNLGVFFAILCISGAILLCAALLFAIRSKRLMLGLPIAVVTVWGLTAAAIPSEWLVSSTGQAIFSPGIFRVVASAVIASCALKIWPLREIKRAEARAQIVPVWLILVLMAATFVLLWEAARPLEAYTAVAALMSGVASFAWFAFADQAGPLREMKPSLKAIFRS